MLARVGSRNYYSDTVDRCCLFWPEKAKVRQRLVRAEDICELELRSFDAGSSRKPELLFRHSGQVLSFLAGEGQSKTTARKSGRSMSSIMYSL